MRSGSALRTVGALASTLLASSSWVSSARAQDWVVTSSETREHESIRLDGDLIVEGGGSLTLRGVTLTFDNAADGQHGIRVKPGGGIDIESGSVITTASGDARMFFAAEVDSSMVMRDSELRRCGWGNEPTWGEGNGLVIHGSIVMENSSISESRQVALVGPGAGEIVGNRFHGDQGLNSHLFILFRSGVTIAGNTFGPSDANGISTYKSHSTVIRDNLFDHTMGDGAIYPIFSWNTEFSHNRVVGGSGPLIVSQSGNTSVVDNTFDGVGGVTVLHSDNATIMRNTMTISQSYQVLLSYSSHAVVADNTMTDSGAAGTLAAVELRHASDSVIANNTIARSTVDQRGRIGLLLWNSSSNNEIRGNVIGAGRRGISIHYGAGGNTVAGNTVQRSSEQPIVVELSERNTIHHNNFLGGGRAPYDDTGTNQWDDGAAGNYWADYGGNGSAPYPIAPSAADAHPLLVPVPSQHADVSANPPLPVTLTEWPTLRVTSDQVISDQIVGPYEGVDVQAGARLTLHNATLLVAGGGHGITVESDGSLEVYDSRIAPPAVDQGGFFFVVLPGATFIMKRSELRGVGALPGASDWGSLFILTSGTVIEDSTIADTSAAISLYSGDRHRITRNTVSMCEAGIVVNSVDTVLSGNRVDRCLAVGIGQCCGATGREGCRVTVRGNAVSHAWEWALSSFGALATGNTFADSGGGILSNGNSTYCSNNLIRNLVQAQAAGGNNAWDCSGRGNYWSDYADVDADHDGVGDTPYLLPGGEQDDHPLMRPMARSLTRHLTVQR